MPADIFSRTCRNRRDAFFSSRAKSLDSRMPECSSTEQGCLLASMLCWKRLREPSNRLMLPKMKLQQNQSSVSMLLRQNGVGRLFFRRQEILCILQWSAVSRRCLGTDVFCLHIWRCLPLGTETPGPIFAVSWRLIKLYKR
ncbi:hypothetical protein AAFF_G00406090 [Aldrovandia affinis]|uniref:Uncharacterized protein n=1 Tax=Aldrovandia affinis TaxID=143900 RepID=A0AAD7SC62_9TELE|nr:hypothetical protein AAFF_G00406090 [Aldrovandia affinis]